MTEKKLVSRRRIQFTEEKTNLKVFREVWDVGNGKEKVYYKYALPDSVQMFAMTTDGMVIAISEFQPGLGADYVHLPGETMEENETPEETAVRGLLEETGYRAGHVELLSSILENSGWSDRLIHTVLLVDCQKVAEGEKEIQTLLLPPKKLWLGLMSYFLHNQGAHGGGNTLKATALALWLLNLFPK